MNRDSLINVLIAVALINTLVIFYLVFEVKALNENLQVAKDTIPSSISSSPSRAEETQLGQADVEPTANADNAIRHSDMQLIQKTIQQELSRYLSAKGQTERELALNEKPTPSNPIILESATQKLEYFLSQGEVSNQSMEVFQAQATRLAPHDRKKLLRNFAKAINSGQLKLVNQ